MPDGAAPGASYSFGMWADGLVVTAGQVGRRGDGVLADGLDAQVDQAIENLAAVLAAAGSGLEQVMKTTCLISDIANFRRFDELYRKWFSDPLPARTTYGVSLAPGLLFEIEAWALRG